MKANHIHLHPDRLGQPLEQCVCGRLSSAVWIIEGDVPDDIDALAVAVEYEDAPAPGSTAPTVARYTAAATQQEDGTWRVYLAPPYFPAAKDGLKYYVIGTDESENPRWLGSGELRILDNPADGSPVAPDILPRNLYAYNPATGLYHKLVAELNDLGEVQVAVDQEGVTL